MFFVLGHRRENAPAFSKSYLKVEGVFCAAYALVRVSAQNDIVAPVASDYDDDACMKFSQVCDP